MKLVAQHVAHKSDDCIFELDEYRDDAGRQFLLAHLRIFKWSPASYKRIKRDWATFRKAVTAPLFANPVQVNDPLWVKFLTRMGWRLFKPDILCHDGLVRPLYFHTV